MVAAGAEMAWAKRTDSYTCVTLSYIACRGRRACMYHIIIHICHIIIYGV